MVTTERPGPEFAAPCGQGSQILATDRRLTLRHLSTPETMLTRRLVKADAVHLAPPSPRADRPAAENGEGLSPQDAEAH